MAPGASWTGGETGAEEAATGTADGRNGATADRHGRRPRRAADWRGGLARRMTTTGGGRSRGLWRPRTAPRRRIRDGWRRRKAATVERPRSSWALARRRPPEGEMGRRRAAPAQPKGGHEPQTCGCRGRNPRSKKNWILGGLISLILTLIFALIPCY